MTTLAFDVFWRDHGAKRGIDATGKSVDGLGNKFDKLDKQSGKTGKLGQRMAGAAKIVGTTAKLAGAGIVGLGAVAFKQFGDFDLTMRQVGVQTKLTGAGMKDMTDLALKMGKETSFSAGEAASAMLELAKGGMSAAQIKGGALQATLTLAAAGGVALGDAGTYMSNALNTFGLKAADAGIVASALAGGANASTASVESLGMALSQVGPGAKQAGLDINETVAALAAFDNAGIKGSDAGTSLKTMLARLIPQTEKQSGAMEKLGINFVNANGSFKSITEIAEILHTKLGKLSEAQRVSTLNTLFGSDASRAAGILMEQGAKGMTKYIKATQDRGAAEKLAKTNTSGAKGAVEQLMGSIETLGIKAGSLIAPGITAVINKTTGLVNWITDTGVPGIATFGTALVEKFIPIGTVRRKMSDFTKDVKDFFTGLFPKTPKAPKMTPVMDLMEHVFDKPTKPMPSTSDMMEHVVGKPAHIASAGEQLGKQLRDAISGGIGKALDNLDWKGLGAKLGTGLLSALDWIKDNANLFGDKIGGAIGGIDWTEIGKDVGGNAAGFAIGFISSLGDDLFSASWWKEHWWDAILGVMAVWGGGKLAKPLIKIFKHIPFLKSLTGPLEALSKSSDLIGKIGGWILAPFKAVGKSLGKGLVKGLFPEAVGDQLWRGIIGAAFKLAKFGAWVIRTISKGKTAILRWFERLGENIGTAIRGAIGVVVREGKNLMKGLLRGVSSVAKTVGGWLNRNVIKKITGAFGKAGSWLHDKGAKLLGGLKNGILSVTKTIGKWEREHIIDPVVNAFSKAGTWLRNAGGKLLGGLKSGVLGVMKTIGKWEHEHIINPLVGTFSKAGGWLKTAGGNLLSGLKTGMLNKLDSAKKWFSSIGSKIVQGVKDFFHIKSPSKVFHGIGGHLIGGLVKGMLDANPAKAATAVFGSMTGAIRKLFSGGFLKDVTNWTGGAANALGDMLLGGAGSGIKLTGNAKRNQLIAASLLPAFGMNAFQMGPLTRLWMGESGWNEFALNKQSGAYGIPQSLPASKMSSAGGDWRTNPRTQIMWGLDYIKSVYGTPLAALNRWQDRNPHWYANGGVIGEPVVGVGRSGRSYVFGEKGPEVVIPQGAMRSGGRGGGEAHYHFHFPNYVGNRAELVKEIRYLTRTYNLAQAQKVRA